MTEPIHLAFLWHQHQPFYKDTLTGRIEMPWVRLHGIKDYFGMAAMLKEYPGVKATINFVPSLLVQLQDQIDGTEDICQILSKAPADSLTEDQRLFILDQFFMTNPNTMIRPLPRYFELYSRRGAEPLNSRTLGRFSDDDIRDLQFLANMAWFHPLAIERDQGLIEMHNRGGGYSEQDKAYLFDRQIEILKQIVPLHRELLERGQIELSTTPFYHPIVPLLIDERSVWEAMPGLRLPRRTQSFAGDAEKQIRRALAHHTEVFGKSPSGMWPSEGSVSQEAAAMFADCGLRWIATDQAILTRSRSSVALPHRHQYRPYRIKGVTGDLSIVFRDHTLSDLLSFQYQYYREEDAVSDFIGRIRSIAATVKERPLCVFVILDGENAWEHYRRTAVPFFSLLYEQLQESKDIATTTISQYLETCPPRETIDRLTAGSWINGDFSIWAGHEEDMAAWEYLDRAREELRIKTASSPGKFDEETLARAWEEILIAEGSDWFWWYGEDHSSSQDMEFDAIFRLHLKNAFRHLGEPYPDFLDSPIKKRPSRPLYTKPTALLHVKVDGVISSYFEWTFAAHYDASADYGSMAKVGRSRLQDVYFGFDGANFLLRVDIDNGISPERESKLVILLRKPERMTLECDISVRGPVSPMCREKDGLVIGTASFQKIFEVSIPLSVLGGSTGTPVEFQIHLEEGNRIMEVLPRGGVFAEEIPPFDHDSRNWGL